MVARQEIRKICRQIAHEFRPQKIVLFGSYAYGKPNSDSDIDLLVVMPHQGRSIDQAIKINSKIEHRFPIDLIVRSPRELRQRLRLNDFFLREIMEKGLVLYESAHA